MDEKNLENERKLILNKLGKLVLHGSITSIQFGGMLLAFLEETEFDLFELLPIDPCQAKALKWS